MSSSEVSLPEAMDFLHKLVAESRKVQAAFMSPPLGIRGALVGKVKISPDNRLWVVAGDEASSLVVAFDPTQPASRRHGDARAAKVRPQEGLSREHFEDGITFMYADGSTFTLFELTEGSAPQRDSWTSPAS